MNYILSQCIVQYVSVSVLLNLYDELTFFPFGSFRTLKINLLISFFDWVVCVCMLQQRGQLLLSLQTAEMDSVCPWMESVSQRENSFSRYKFNACISVCLSVWMCASESESAVLAKYAYTYKEFDSSFTSLAMYLFYISIISVGFKRFCVGCDDWWHDLLHIPDHPGLPGLPSGKTVTSNTVEISFFVVEKYSEGLLKDIILSHYPSPNDATQLWLSLWPTDESPGICIIMTRVSAVTFPEKSQAAHS